MTFKVLITGKPCAGKTTQSNRVEEALNGEGIYAIAINNRAHKDKGGVIGQIESENVAKVAAVALFTYFGQYLQELVKMPDVLIIQRTPLDFVHAAETKKDEESGKIRILGKMAEFFSRAVRPDVVIHLSVGQDTLLQRFKSRPDNRDSTHQSLIVNSDGKLVSLLMGLAGEGNIVDVGGDRPVQDVTKDIMATIKGRLRA